MSSSSPTEIQRALALEGSIGATPLVELARFSKDAARIFAKLEWFNPGGSVKDRIARAMIADAERRGAALSRRHDRGADLGQHRCRARHARGGQGVSLRDRDAGGLRPRQGEADGGSGRDGRPDAVRGPHDRSDRARPEDHGQDSRRLHAEPVRQSRQRPGALRDDGARDRRGPRRLDGRVRRRRRDDRDVHRRRALLARTGRRISSESRPSRRARSSAEERRGRTRSRGSASPSSPRSSTAARSTRSSRSRTRRPSRRAGAWRARKGSSPAVPRESRPRRRSNRAAPRAGQDRGDDLPGRGGAVPGAGDIWRVGSDRVRESRVEGPRSKVPGPDFRP